MVTIDELPALIVAISRVLMDDRALLTTAERDQLSEAVGEVMIALALAEEEESVR